MIRDNYDGSLRKKYQQLTQLTWKKYSRFIFQQLPAIRYRYVETSPAFSPRFCAKCAIRLSSSRVDAVERDVRHVVEEFAIERSCLTLNGTLDTSPHHVNAVTVKTRKCRSCQVAEENLGYAPFNNKIITTTLSSPCAVTSTTRDPSSSRVARAPVYRRRRAGQSAL